MNSLLSYLIFMPPILWSLSFISYISIQKKKIGNTLFVAGVATFGLHFFLHYIVGRLMPSSAGSELSSFDFSSFYFLAFIGAIFTLVGQYRADIKPLPMFTLPILIIFSLLTLNFQSDHLQSRVSLLLSSHIGLAIVGQLCAIGAFICSLIYTIQYYRLKRKNISGLIKDVPSLDRLAQLNYKLVVIGFGMISLGLITGFIYVQINQVDSYEIFQKIFWAISVWVWYFIIILGKNIFKVSYSNLALLSLGGFGIIIAGFFGIDLSEVFKLKP